MKAARKEQPANESIKEEIRKLDQESRDEYFRQQAFTLSGAGLLCGGIVVSLAAAKWAATLRRKHPQLLPVAAPARLGGKLDAGRAVDRRRAVRRARCDGGRLDLAVARHGGGEAGRSGGCGGRGKSQSVKAAGEKTASQEAGAGEKTCDGLRRARNDVTRGTRDARRTLATRTMREGNDWKREKDGTTKERPLSVAIATARPRSPPYPKKNWLTPGLASAAAAARESRPTRNVPDDWDGPSGKNIVWKSPLAAAGQ